LNTGLSATAGPVAGHPLWHFGIVAAAAILAYGGIRVRETWGRSLHRFRPPNGATAMIAVLGLACSGAHAFICPDHFHEWVIYGLFFMTASVVQAAWSILILFRPDAWLLLAGAAGNAAIVVTYLISRTLGIPFGPDAFHPESYDALSVAVTACETAIVAISLYTVATRLRARPFGHPAPAEPIAHSSMARLPANMRAIGRCQRTTPTPTQT